jgi:hypothetical protein
MERFVERGLAMLLVRWAGIIETQTLETHPLRRVRGCKSSSREGI